MSKKMFKTIVNVKNVKPHRALTPKQDPKFISLFKGAVGREVPTYFAQIPLRLIRPFDEVFLPQYRHPDGQLGVQIMTNLINLEKAPALWVYPEGGVFVLSDDYHAYEAYRDAQTEYLPCYVMGEPTTSGLKAIQGPLEGQDVLKAMGVVVVDDPSN